MISDDRHDRDLSRHDALVDAAEARGIDTSDPNFDPETFADDLEDEYLEPDERAWSNDDAPEGWEP